MGKQFNASNVDLTGPAGKAWEIKTGEEAPYVIAAWIAECPGQHALWNRYMITTITLRDEPGEQNPALKDYPEAEWETVVCALDPTADDQYPFQILRPMNYTGQYDGCSIIGAREITRDVVRFFLDGKLPIEPFMPAHRTAFTTLLRNTPLHDRIGHPGLN